MSFGGSDVIRIVRGKGESGVTKVLVNSIARRTVETLVLQGLALRSKKADMALENRPSSDRDLSAATELLMIDCGGEPM